MTITIHLRDQLFTLDPPLTVQQALERLGLHPESYLVLSSGKLLHPEDRLEDGAEVTLVPAIAGG